MMIEFENLKYWPQLLMLSLSAAAARMVVAKEKGILRFGGNVIVALFVAYITDGVCNYYSVSVDIKPGIIGLSSYLAPQILMIVSTFGDRASKDPGKWLKFVMSYKLRKDV